MFRLPIGPSVLLGLLPLGRRMAAKALPGPLPKILGLQGIPPQPLTKEDFLNPSLRGQRFVIKCSRVQTFPVFEGNFLYHEEDPGIPDEHPGCTYIVASLDHKDHANRFVGATSIASEWNEKEIRFELEKMFNGRFQYFSV